MLERTLLLSLDCSTLPLIRTLYCRVLSKEVSSTIFKSLVWRGLGLNLGLPDLWRTLYPLSQWASKFNHNFVCINVNQNCESKNNYTLHHTLTSQLDYVKKTLLPAPTLTVFFSSVLPPRQGFFDRQYLMCTSSNINFIVTDEILWREVTETKSPLLGFYDISIVCKIFYYTHIFKKTLKFSTTHAHTRTHTHTHAHTHKHIYIYIYIYEVHTISFQTFFVWALFLIVHT